MTQTHKLSNETNAVSGRRIAKFFDTKDPNTYGPAQLLRAQTAIRQLPDLLSRAVLPIDQPLPRDFSTGETRVRISSALAEWLCGMQAREAGKLAGWPEDRNFDSFIQLDAAMIIGGPEVYDALFDEQERANEA